MTRLKFAALAVVAGAVVALPQAASAQKPGKSAGHGKGHAPVEHAPVVKVDKNRDRGSDRDSGGSPAFCRSGAGHPVFGREWCIEKGFGLGSTEWGRARWGDVVLGTRRGTTGSVGGSILSDILGRVIYGRLQSQAGAIGGGALTGRWVNTSGAPLLLQVQAGGRPLAEFVDRDRDGHADVVLLNLGR